MRPLLFCTVAVSIFVLAVPVSTAESNHKGHSKYAGQEKRVVKSLSPQDIDELKRGGGWGLAKAAELNGVPGPAHLLELKDQIPLNDKQVAAITKIYNDMKSRAIELGHRLIEQEKALEVKFKNNSINRDGLKHSLSTISKVRNDLRYVHLATHLETPKILSRQQITKYNQLRGYGNSEPCNNVPSGHNAEKWRQHNGCNE